jgi:hypothetical protein
MGRRRRSLVGRGRKPAAKSVPRPAPPDGVPDDDGLEDDQLATEIQPVPAALAGRPEPRSQGYIETGEMAGDTTDPGWSAYREPPTPEPAAPRIEMPEVRAPEPTSTPTDWDALFREAGNAEADLPPGDDDDLPRSATDEASLDIRGSHIELAEEPADLQEIGDDLWGAIDEIEPPDDDDDPLGDDPTTDFGADEWTNEVSSLEPGLADLYEDETDGDTNRDRRRIQHIAPSADDEPQVGDDAQDLMASADSDFKFSGNDSEAIEENPFSAFDDVEPESPKAKVDQPSYVDFGAHYLDTPEPAGLAGDKEEPEIPPQQTDGPASWDAAYSADEAPLEQPPEAMNERVESAPRAVTFRRLLPLVAAGAVLAGVFLCVAFVDLASLAESMVDELPDPSKAAALEFSMPVSEEAPALEPAAPDSHIKGVEVRKTLRRQPRMVGEEEVDPTDHANRRRAREVVRAELTSPPGGRTPGSSSAGAPALPEEAPAAAPVPAPGAAPAPRPEPAPSAVPSPAPSDSGFLTVRSNRRVIVYVDGSAVGYTPANLAVRPGEHSVKAMVPGQPDSQQTRRADVTAVGQNVAIDFTF